jgi:hypothetical protein
MLLGLVGLDRVQRLCDLRDEFSGTLDDSRFFISLLSSRVMPTQYGAAIHQ